MHFPCRSELFGNSVRNRKSNVRNLSWTVPSCLATLMFSPPRSPTEWATIRYLCLNFNTFFCGTVYCIYRCASFKICNTGKKKSMMGCRCILQELQEQGSVVSKTFFTVILHIAKE